MTAAAAGGALFLASSNRRREEEERRRRLRNQGHDQILLHIEAKVDEVGKVLADNLGATYQDGSIVDIDRTSKNAKVIVYSLAILLGWAVISVLRFWSSWEFHPYEWYFNHVDWTAVFLLIPIAFVALITKTETNYLGIDLQDDDGTTLLQIKRYYWDGRRRYDELEIRSMIKSLEKFEILTDSDKA